MGTYENLQKAVDYMEANLKGDNLAFANCRAVGQIGMQVYDYIDGVWLPDSGVEVADLPDYEVHDANTGLIEINVSVK